MLPEWIFLPGQAVADAMSRWPMGSAAVLVGAFVWQMAYIVRSLWRAGQGK